MIMMTGARYVSPALGRAVLNDDDGSGRRSMVIMGTRRRCSRSLRSVAHQRANYFFPAQGGGGARKGGAGLR